MTEKYDHTKTKNLLSGVTPLGSIGPARGVGLLESFATASVNMADRVLSGPGISGIIPQRPSTGMG